MINGVILPLVDFLGLLASRGLSPVPVSLHYEIVVALVLDGAWTLMGCKRSEMSLLGEILCFGFGRISEVFLQAVCLHLGPLTLAFDILCRLDGVELLWQLSELSLVRSQLRLLGGLLNSRHRVVLQELLIHLLLLQVAGLRRVREVQLTMRPAGLVDLLRHLVWRCVVRIPYVLVERLILLVGLESWVNDLREVSLPPYLLSVADLRRGLLHLLIAQLVETSAGGSEDMVLTERLSQLWILVVVGVHVRNLALELLVVIEVSKLDVVVHAPLHLVIVIHSLEAGLDVGVIVLS